MLKIKSIDLFAGCGGLMDGFEQSGFYDTLAVVEWEKAPCRNIQTRLKDKWKYDDSEKRVLNFDIQRAEELFSGWDNDKLYGSHEGLDSIVNKNGGIDLIIGGPPCQAYSIAGRVRDENGMKNDYRNYLFESYLKVVEHYRPKAFVFENVPGILTAKPNDRLIIEIIQEKFYKAGYYLLSNLHDAIIDFTEYGIPQNRSRIIILGLDKNFYGEEKCKFLLNSFYKELLPAHKTRKMTAWEAIGDLPKLYPLGHDEKYNGKKISHSLPQPFVENHIARWQSNRDIEIFKLLEKDIEDKKFEYISAEKLKELYTQKTGHTSNVHKYHVIRKDQPSNLIPAHLYKDGLRHIHPESIQARSITVREAARLQTFDDDYIFYGSNVEVFKMIGNAVPPKFSKILATTLYELLFKEE